MIPSVQQLPAPLLNGSSQSPWCSPQNRPRETMHITGRRVFSAVMLLGCFVTTYQLFSRPQPVAEPQSQDVAKANASSFDQKIERLETPRSSSDAPTEVRFTSDEVSAEIAPATRSPPAATTNPVPAGAPAATTEPAKHDSAPPSSPDATISP